MILVACFYTGDRYGFFMHSHTWPLPPTPSPNKHHTLRITEQNKTSPDGVDWGIHVRPVWGKERELAFINTLQWNRHPTKSTQKLGQGGYFRGQTKIAAFLLLISITYGSLPQHNLQMNNDTETEKV